MEWNTLLYKKEEPNDQKCCLNNVICTKIKNKLICINFRSILQKSGQSILRHQHFLKVVQPNYCHFYQKCYNDGNIVAGYQTNKLIGYQTMWEPSAHARSSPSIALHTIPHHSTPHHITSHHITPPYITQYHTTPYSV